MADIAIFLLLVIATALGFILGRYSRRKHHSERYPKDYALNYYKGLSYLFNEQPDSAIDAFIGALEVNSDTLETHLALGNMLRRRGEVTKAIKVHQNLLARPRAQYPPAARVAAGTGARLCQVGPAGQG